LKIYNANVKELQDTPGSEYFAFLSRKAHEGALNQARVDVAEARMRGEIGESEKQGKTKQETSKIDAETAVLETKRRAEKAKADADLVDCKTALDARNEMSKITAKRQNEMKESELQKQLQAKKAETELERLRANDVTKSKVAREAAQETANASYYTEQKAADAHLYKRKIEADALYYRQSKEADAAFYKQKREGEGLVELSKGYGALVDVLGGPQAFLQFQMMQNGTYEKLAHANAQAINGLQPKITTWNTGNGNIGDSAAPIRNIMQNLPPLLSTIQEQTGISPPTCLAQMPNGHTKEPKMEKTPSG
jgi:flotillin